MTEQYQQTKPVNPTLKMVLEYGPIILFFMAYTFLKDRNFLVAGTEYSGFVTVTAVFIPVLALATLGMWKLTGHLSKMQIMALVLVVVFGGLSIWFNDERFFKMKPTMIYLLFAGILGFGLMRKQSYLEGVLYVALPLKREGWVILTKRLIFFFIGLAAANEVIWRMMTTDAWVNFKIFGLSLGTIVFFMAQGGLVKRYRTEDDSE